MIHVFIGKIRRYAISAITVTFTLFFCPVAFFAQNPDLPPLEQPTPHLEPGELTRNELFIMDQALATMNVDRSDLGFRKDYIDDPFRLPAVQQALDDPLSLVRWNYGWDAFLLEEKRTGDILHRMASDLGSEVAEVEMFVPGFDGSGGVSAFTDSLIPAGWREPLDRLDQALFIAGWKMSTDVLAALTPKERAFLQSYLLCHFSDEEREGCPEVTAYTVLEDFRAVMEKFPVVMLLSVARELSVEIDLFVESIQNISGEWRTDSIVALEGRSGTILVGSKKNDFWSPDSLTDAVFILDPGGNDTYAFPVATAGNLQGEHHPVVSVSIDLSGDDAYLSGDARAFGSGVLGIGMLADLSGNDTYRSGQFSQGCGVFGVGILLDKCGNDIYEADALVQGAGAVGAGLLVDLHGFDTYRGAIYAQGFGYTRGFGMLTDRHGYDCYYAGGRYDSYPVWGQYIISMSQGYGFGIRSDASGGIGILHDRDGKDYYNAEVFSQGGSYWYGIGALIDDNGNDHYQSEVYSQGAGVHLSAGILLDRGGNDTYASLHQAQGFAHDLSVGWLIDEGGDDQYTGMTNAQGVAVTNSVAGLIDRSGDDAYMCRQPNRGMTYGGTTRGYGSIAMLIDMAGNDSYTDPLASNGGWWEYGNWAAGIDVGENWWEITLDGEGAEIDRQLSIPGMTR
jgi:hypothetical protein